MTANIQHDRSRIIARTGDGGLTLTDSENALTMALEFLGTREAQDARELTRRGVLGGVSVEFEAIKDRWTGNHRTIEKAVLSGLALVDRAAYPHAKVEAVRSEVVRPKRAGLLRY